MKNIPAVPALPILRVMACLLKKRLRIHAVTRRLSNRFLRKLEVDVVVVVGVIHGQFSHLYYYGRGRGFRMHITIKPSAIA